MPQIEGDEPVKKAFKAYPVGHFHIDIAEVQTAEGRLYLFVAVDRTSKFAFVQLVDNATRGTASAFLEALVAAVPYRIHTVLTDNGIQFRFAPRYADGPTAKYMTHMFDMRCRENGIGHRFTKINHPWTTDEIEQLLSGPPCYFPSAHGGPRGTERGVRCEPRRAAIMVVPPLRRPWVPGALASSSPRPVAGRRPRPARRGASPPAGS